MEKRFKHKDLDPRLLQAIGYVAVVAGNVENYLEDAILDITKEPTFSIYPSTDGQSVNRLINKLASLDHSLPSAEWKKAVQLWCCVASNAFICRNAILHGRSIAYDSESLAFITNTRFRGELRKRASKDFIATVSSADMLARVFEVLERSIMGMVLVAGNRVGESAVFTPSFFEDLFVVDDLIRELVHLLSAYNSDKY